MIATILMKEILKVVNTMDKELKIILMSLPTQVDLIMIKDMVRDYTHPLNYL